MADPNRYRKLTQAELLAEARERFGEDPLDWAFQCPGCGDVATGRDFRQVLADHSRTEHDGRATLASDLLGQECIGRTLGVLEGPPTKSPSGPAARGCDWAAYGFFHGPWEIVMPDGHSAWAFPLANPVLVARDGARDD
jgi:hypothetical protein